MFIFVFLFRCRIEKTNHNTISRILLFYVYKPVIIRNSYSILSTRSENSPLKKQKIIFS